MLHDAHYNYSELQVFKILVYNSIKNKLNLNQTIDNLKSLLDKCEIASFLKEIDYNKIFEDCNDEYLHNLANNLYLKLDNETTNKLKEILYEKKTILFTEQNFYEDGFCNQMVGFLMDMLSDRLLDDCVIGNVDIYFDEFFNIARNMENLDLLFKDLKKEYIDKIRISVFYQNVEQIKYSTLNRFKDKKSIIEFFDLFDTVISLGVYSMESVVFIGDYMGFNKSMNMSYSEIQKMEIRKMLICRNNKTFIIEKNIISDEKTDKIDIRKYRETFLKKQLK